MSDSFVLTTDSCVDLPASYMRENNIPFVSLSYTMSGLTYLDDLGETMSDRAFYSRIKAGEESTTTQVNPGQYVDFFTPFLQEGKDILYLAFSSGLSGSHGSAVIAAEMLKEKFPDRRVVVVDSLSASMGQGLLLTHALTLKNDGATLDEVARWLEANRLHMCHFFTVNDLFHLYRGGRLSKGSAILGSLIGIKPLLHVDNNGRLAPIGKVRGRTGAINALADFVEKHGVNMDRQTVYISHGDCLEDAEFLAAILKRRFRVPKILINPVGPVIGSHAGQGVLALFFVGGSRGGKD
ncbi:MAG TPA: DegV family protein [Clostridiales bacterium]|nr:DegV family protein [Clostridiales bacterium]